MGKTSVIHHEGKGPDPLGRQKTPHVHFVGITPDKKYVYAVDLGSDKVVLYEYTKEQLISLIERIEKMIDTEYVFQQIDSNLPDGFVIPEGRTKPWGTTQAMMSIIWCIIMEKRIQYRFLRIIMDKAI